MNLCEQDVVDLNRAADEIDYYVDQTSRSAAMLTLDEKHTLWDARKVLRDLAGRIAVVMKFCKHRRVTYEKVLQGGLWFRASCGDCQRSGAFADSQDKALAKLQCVQATVRR